MTGIIVHDKEGSRHEILLPKDEHLLEYVRRAQMAIEGGVVRDGGGP